ncbi:class I lysyl-tRNA synthetase [Bacillus phage Bastille]|uniref:Class I lysyl-tRNA synthetase n=1 Tax=Bacillus phage Bastille TaxID=57477 RepID=J9PKN0_9CAUD|nr:class I lysyl-tRNA synthetase [Bacillus phage Bastille]AEQ34379.1 class I lysyl-tRNA synthetase [Bacillus phage Bastille]
MQWVKLPQVDKLVATHNKLMNIPYYEWDALDKETQKFHKSLQYIKENSVTVNNMKETLRLAAGMRELMEMLEEFYKDGRFTEHTELENAVMDLIHDVHLKYYPNSVIREQGVHHDI